MENYNSMIFNSTTEKEEVSKFLNILLEMNIKNDRFYNDIHIRQEEEFIIIEWTQVHYNDSYEDGKFKFVDADQVIQTEYILPDNSTILLSSDDEFKEYLEDWLKENPGWVRTSYGTWTNEIENENFKKMMSQEKASSEEDDDLFLD